MKVRITFEADKRLRRAINYQHGLDGLANYEEVKLFFQMYGESCIDDICSELPDGETDHEC